MLTTKEIKNLPIAELPNIVNDKNAAYPVAVIISWILQNKQEFGDIIQDKISAVLDQPPINIKEIPMHKQLYSDEHWKSVFYDDSVSSLYCPYLYMAIFCATRYEGQDCHSFFFGTPQSIILPDAVSTFLNAYQNAPSDEKKRIQAILEADKLDDPNEPTNNICYVLRERLQEIAFANGINLKKTISSCVSSSSARITASDLDNPQPRHIPPDHYKQAGTSQAILVLALMASYKYQVSLDYLIMLDYSSHPSLLTSNGAIPIADTLRPILSMYLLASPSAKSNARNEALLHEMGIRQTISTTRYSIPDPI